MENREKVLLEKALGGFQRTAKILTVVFILAVLVFLFFAGAMTASLVMSGSLTAPLLTAVVSAVVQDGVMIVAFAICALLSWDMSKGISPFCRKQVGRIRAIAWVMLGYVVFCAVWDPFLAPVVFSDGMTAYGISSSSDGVRLYINFEALLASCAFFLFSYILNYGRTLQQLSDESM